MNFQVMENKKKVAVMQPYLFPYLGYFQLINAVDTFVIYDDVNFIVRGWINRNNILVNGQAHLISIPLVKASQNRIISDTALDPDTKWKARLLKTVEAAYRKAPEFEKVFPLFIDLLNDSCEGVSDLNYQAIKAVCDYLSINTTIIQSSSVYQNGNLKGQHRVLDICLQNNAQVYINPIGGKEIYDRTVFTDKEIEICFLKTQFSPYPQFNFEFIPGLSILDYLMFLPPEEIHKKLGEYSLETN